MNQPLEPIRPEPAPVDLDTYRPIPGRPGWYINARGQMDKDGVLPPVAPWYGVLKP